MKVNKKIRNILSFGVFSVMLFSFSTNISHANNNIEDEFNSVLKRYENKKIEFEDGIVLELGEKIDLKKYKDVELSNNKVAKINKDGYLETLSEGTVFLSIRINNIVYIVEIYVDNNLNKPKIARNNVLNNKYKVFIDAGHGGSDPGSVANGVEEADLNLAVAKLVKEKLNAKGIDVLMSRETDIFYSLGQRGEMSNDYDPDVFVSIHHNSASSSAYGIETYYHSKKSQFKPLSDDIQENLIIQTNGKSRGVKNANFSVLRTTYSPSSLVECGFITNIEEVNKLKTPEYQEKLATGIADGVERYLLDNIVLDNSNTQVIKTGTVNTDWLNVRKGYGNTYDILGSIPKDSTVEIVGERNGWYKIKYYSRFGYVSSNYVTIGEEKPPVVENPDNNENQKPENPPVNPDNKPTNPEIKLTDIDSHWAKESIIDFVSKGILNGYEDNTFKPDNSITRAEFVKIVNKVFGFSEVGEVKFTDVNENDWYYNELQIAVNKGYINGYEDNTFRPNNQITRQEAASIISNILKISGDGNLDFADKDSIGDWAKSSVDALNDNNIMGGYEDNTFRPNNNMTRAEAVVTLSRLK